MKVSTPSSDSMNLVMIKMTNPNVWALAVSCQLGKTFKMRYHYSWRQYDRFKVVKYRQQHRVVKLIESGNCTSYNSKINGFGGQPEKDKLARRL